jgi:hypothetical protein
MFLGGDMQEVAVSAAGLEFNDELVEHDFA